MGLHKAAQKQDPDRGWYLAAAATAITFALQLGGDEVREALAYSREYLALGEFWRLATGHFVHLGWTHLLLNLAGLALVGWLVGPAYNWREWLFITGISLATIDAGFWFLYPELAWYVGLSGLLHGLLTAGLFPRLLARDRESLVLVAFVAAKLVWEQTGGPLPGSEATSGGTVIVDAHLYGALGGFIAAYLMWRRVRPKSPI
jgi:rhomboid family GlyGly-CTERM serine protease